MDSGVQTNWNNTLLFVRGTVPGRSSVTAVHQVMQLFYDLQLYRYVHTGELISVCLQNKTNL